MEPLYEGLLQQKFMSSTEAIEFCRQTCQEYGFTVKQETGANKVSINTKKKKKRKGVSAYLINGH